MVPSGSDGWFSSTTTHRYRWGPSGRYRSRYCVCGLSSYRRLGLRVEEARLGEVEVEGPPVVGRDLEVGLDPRDERRVAGLEGEELLVAEELDELDRGLDGRRGAGLGR